MLFRIYRKCHNFMRCSFFPFRIVRIIDLLHLNVAELYEGGDSTNDEQPKHLRLEPYALGF